MEKSYTKILKIIVTLITIVCIITIITPNSFAAQKLKLSKIKVKDELKFTGGSWYTYSSLTNATHLKKPTGILKTGDKITVAKVYLIRHVIKANDGRYIYYGTSAESYFEKVVKKISVTSISLNKTSEDLIEGNTVKLKATVAPNNSTNKQINWSSSDSKIASVSSDGIVTAIKEGTAVITAKAADGSGAKAKCTIKVKKPIEMFFENERESAELEEPIDLSSKLTIKNSTNNSVIWTSSNEEVVQIVNKKTGEMKALKLGTSTITVTSQEDKTKTAVCVLTIVSNGVKIEQFKLNKTSTTIIIGKTEQLNPTIKVTPNLEVNKKLMYTSSNEEIATVNAKGLITAKKAGTTTITVTPLADMDKKIECKVTVKEPEIDKVAVEGSTKVLSRGETLKLKATVKPSNANQEVKWSSDNKNVKVDQNGVVTVNSKVVNGEKAVITATSKANKNKKATWTITIRVKVTAINLIQSKTIKVGETYTLGIGVLPSDAYKKSVTWSSSNSKIVTVNKSGKIKGIAAGTATITVEVADGSGVKSKCKVKVEPKKTYMGVELQYSKAYHISNNPLTASKGVVYYNGHKETYYSQKRLPGGGLTALNNNGRHVAEDGTIRDKDGYIAVACNYLSKGSCIMTSLGPGKVYDKGDMTGKWVDIYVNW